MEEKKEPGQSSGQGMHDISFGFILSPTSDDFHLENGPRNNTRRPFSLFPYYFPAGSYAFRKAETV